MKLEVNLKLILLTIFMALMANAQLSESYSNYDQQLQQDPFNLQDSRQDILIDSQQDQDQIVFDDQQYGSYDESMQQDQQQDEQQDDQQDTYMKQLFEDQLFDSDLQESEQIRIIGDDFEDDYEDEDDDY